MLAVGVPKKLAARNQARNPYGLNDAEITMIAQSLHARAKQRIKRGRSKKFEDLL
jgi:hypothetical protein